VPWSKTLTVTVVVAAVMLLLLVVDVLGDNSVNIPANFKPVGAIETACSVDGGGEVAVAWNRSGRVETDRYFK